VSQLEGTNSYDDSKGNPSLVGWHWLQPEAGRGDRQGKSHEGNVHGD
jgi:hypothetical protein